MLILTRKPGESLYIGDNIKITIVDLKGHQIRVGIDAPVELRIYREEIYLQILEENRRAAEASMATDIGLENLSAAWSEQHPPAALVDSGTGGDEEDHESGRGKAEEEKPVVSAFSSFKTSRSGPGAPGGTFEVVVKKRRAKKQDE